VQYANERNFRGGNETIIEAGVQVRQGQVIIRLPDPAQMQVDAEINESSTRHVEVGMPATIVVRSVSPQKLRGRVVKVNDYPEPGSFFSSNVKKYATTIEVQDLPQNLKPGLTAEVKIQVQSQSDALQVPLPCVVQHAGFFYCIAKEGDSWQLRQVQIGLSNEQNVVIRSGLSEGELVVANPRRHRQIVEWPAIAPPGDAGPDGDNQPPADGSPPSPAPAAGNLADQRGGPSSRPDKERPSGRGGMDPGAMADGILQRLDKNADGRVSGDEMAAVPQEQRERLMQSDTNKDGALDRGELMQGAARRREARP
jgi:hypothetical protein